jgi:hypothetical protein
VKIAKTTTRARLNHLIVLCAPLSLQEIRRLDRLSHLLKINLRDCLVEIYLCNLAQKSIAEW